MQKEKISICNTIFEKAKRLAFEVQFELDLEKKLKMLSSMRTQSENLIKEFQKQTDEIKSKIK